MKPILFNTEMVRAILEGRKTVTRRVIKPQPWDSVFCDGHEFMPDDYGGCKPTGFICRKCGLGVCPPHCKYPVGEALFRPYCWPDDILYVRETWAKSMAGTYMYKATDDPIIIDRWHPSIHMPKEAARLFLRVTDVRVERLQDITPEQARAEGCDGRCNCPSSGAPGSLSCVEMDFSIEKFESVWDSTIKPADLPLYGWYANPWIWVIEFERCEKPEGDR